MADDTHSRFATVSENDMQFLASGWPYDKAYGARSFVRHLNMMNRRLKCRTMADDILSLSRTCFVYLLAKQHTTLKWKNVISVFSFLRCKLATFISLIKCNLQQSLFLKPPAWNRQLLIRCQFAICSIECFCVDIRPLFAVSDGSFCSVYDVKTSNEWWRQIKNILICIGWRDVTGSVATIQSLFCGYNMA